MYFVEETGSCGMDSVGVLISDSFPLRFRFTYTHTPALTCIHTYTYSIQIFTFMFYSFIYVFGKVLRTVTTTGISLRLTDLKTNVYNFTR